jgi:hypothetical protein
VSEAKRITPGQIGYWAKGDRQIVVQIALDHGMEPAVGESVSPEKARDWLNENAVPEGLRFDWWGIFFILIPEKT